MNTPASAVVPSREATQEEIDHAEELFCDNVLSARDYANLYIENRTLLAEVESLNVIIGADDRTIEELCEQVGKLRAEVERQSVVVNNADEVHNAQVKVILDLRATVAQNESKIRQQAERITKYRKRLEVDGHYEGSPDGESFVRVESEEDEKYDGIECRNLTIAGLEERNAELRTTIADQAAALAERDKDAERLAAFEAWADRGLCPYLVFNDNGWWAVSFDGSGDVSLEEPPPEGMFTALVEANAWRETVAEAIDAALAANVSSASEEGK